MSENINSSMAYNIVNHHTFSQQYHAELYYNICRLDHSNIIEDAQINKATNKVCLFDLNHDNISIYYDVNYQPVYHQIITNALNNKTVTIQNIDNIQQFNKFIQQF